MNFSYIFLFVISFLINAITLKPVLIDDHQFTIRRAWNYIQSDFFERTNLPKDQITLSQFSSSYLGSQISFIFAAKNKITKEISIYKYILEESKVSRNIPEEFQTLSYQKYSSTNKISIHEKVYHAIHKQIQKYITKEKLKLHHIKKIEKFEGDFDFYRLFLVTAKLSGSGNEIRFYISVNNMNNYGYVYLVSNDAEEELYSI